MSDCQATPSSFPICIEKPIQIAIERTGLHMLSFRGPDNGGVCIWVLPTLDTAPTCFWGERQVSSLSGVDLPLAVATQ